MSFYLLTYCLQLLNFILRHLNLDSFQAKILQYYPNAIQRIKNYLTQLTTVKVRINGQTESKGYQQYSNMVIIIKIQNLMSTSPDQQIIRTYSSHLRFLQLGVQIFICQMISKIDKKGCSTTISSVGQPICIILAILNIIALAVIKYMKVFNKNIFIVVFVINVVLSSVLAFVGLIGIGEINSCANNRVLMRFVGLEALIAIVTGLLTMYSKYDFGIRYTNAPGNFVWVFLFFSFDWTRRYKTLYIPVAIINLIISLSNLGTHLSFQFFNGPSNIKRLIYLLWIASLIAMVIAQLMVFLAYITSGNDTNTMVDNVAKKLAQAFMFVNVVDGLFWLYGLMGLKIQAGDAIDEEAFGIQEHGDRHNVV